MDWIEQLKNCKTRDDRIALALDTKCPVEVLSIMIEYDVEPSVIEAAIRNHSCTNKLTEIGINRLRELNEKETPKNSLCPIPWNHLVIQQNGDLRQCCQMIHPPYGRFLDGDKPLRFSNENMEAVRNDEIAKQLRHEMMNNKKSDLCRLCWQEEDVGISSKRINMLKQYDMKPLLENTSEDGTIDIDKIPLAYLDLRLGNLCNLKCRSCGPGDSSLWVEDHAELTQKDNKAKMTYYNNQTYDIVKTKKGWEIDSDDFNWHNDPKFHSWLEDKINNGLDRIYFTGGEPTVNKNHMMILEKIIQLNKAKDFTLEYNTNMVAIPPKLIKYWDNFKQINIGASIDAIGPLAKYVRYPSNWTIIEKNCDKLGYNQLPQIRVGLATTISILNVRHLPDISKWLIGKGYTSFSKWPSWHLLHKPLYLNIQALPNETKLLIEKEYDNFYRWTLSNMNPQNVIEIKRDYSKIIKFMNQESRINELPKLKAAMKNLDNIRNESLEISIPWLYELL